MRSPPFSPRISATGAANGPPRWAPRAVAPLLPRFSYRPHASIEQVQETAGAHFVKASIDNLVGGNHETPIHAASAGCSIANQTTVSVNAFRYIFGIAPATTTVWPLTVTWTPKTISVGLTESS